MNNIRKLRTQKKMTQSKLGELLGVQDAAVSKYESGKLPLTDDTLKKLAKIFDVTTDYILNLEPPNQRITNEEWNKKLPELTKKDELDIKKDLEKMLGSLSSNQGYAHFGGESLEDLDEEDKELLINSLENTMKLAKKLAKQKFTPHKYRK